MQIASKASLVPSNCSTEIEEGPSPSSTQRLSNADIVCKFSSLRCKSTDSPLVGIAIVCKKRLTVQTCKATADLIDDYARARRLKSDD
jgi:hypothetical protein